MKEPKIKKRKLKYNGEKSTKELLLIKDILEKLPGVQRTDIDLLNKLLIIEYDLNDIQLALIIEKMEEIGFQLSRQRFQRFKRGWIKFTETNEKENLMVVPRTCCHIPRSYYLEKKGDKPK